MRHTDSLTSLFRITTAFVMLACSVDMAAVSVTGIIRDGAARPVSGAIVSSVPDGVKTTSASDGRFTIDLNGEASLRVSHPGFETQMIAVNRTSGILEIALSPLQSFSSNVVVSAIRASDEAPVAKTDISQGEIRQRDRGQDVPMLLQSTPSVTAYADSGSGGSGYSFFRLRGIDQTRINMTLDGVPLAESEDLGVYFTNFTDLLGSVETIQIQRGVGTSSVGAPSFGGSINFESRAHDQDSSLEAKLGGGSFGTRNVAAGWQSGFLSNGVAIAARVSANESDGYRDHSGIEQYTTLVSVIRAGDRDSWKLLAFTGREEQQLAFYASDETALASNPRDNPLSEEETDRFGQDFIQVQYQRAVGAAASVAVSAYTNRGHGYFRLWDDPVGRAELLEFGLDGRLTGLMLTASTVAGSYSVTSGVHANQFARSHTLHGAASRFYENEGRKDEQSAFVKVEREAGRFLLYGDAQVRHADFRYGGDVAVEPVDWTFFNPKVGVRFSVTPRVGLFASLGRSSREPTRSDMFSGEDNATISHDLRSVKPEKVTDLEAGMSWSSPSLSVSANLYAMEFRDEIAATGELSEVGLLLRRNVDRSYRRGLELDAEWRAGSTLSLRLVSSLSRNRILEWVQNYDVYDESGSYLESRLIAHRDVKPLLTPELVIDLSGVLRPTASTQLELGIRHVGESQLDNTGSKLLVAPSYTRVNLGARYEWNRPSLGSPALRVHVDNLFDADDHYPGGYSYPFVTRGEGGEEELSGTRYFYPLSTRAITASVEWRIR